MAASVDLGTATAPHAVLVCQSCPYVWEPDGTSSDEFAALVRTGCPDCPDCGGWVWLGELVSGVR